MKKISAILLALVMMLSMVAMAATNAAGTATSGTITIENAAKGVEYKIYKLFSASVTGTVDGSIVYTGDIPAALAEYFVKDANGYITANTEKTDKEITDAVAAWAATATATDTEVAQGGALTFSNLEFGYYAVISGQGSVVTVDSTNPNASIYDKNSTVPLTDLSKTVADNGDDDATDNVASFNIGDTVTYTVTFKTANYSGDGADAEQIVNYHVADTLPSFLTDVAVTSVSVDNVALTGTYDFGDDKAFDIAWVNAEGNSLYANGATVTIVYTATVTDAIAIAQANTNTVTVTWTTDGEDTDSDSKTANIYSYQLTVNKVDATGNALTGAKFELYLSADGTDKVMLIKDGDNYRPATEEEQEVEGFTSAIIDAGTAVIQGLATDTYYLQETQAPAGYNMLTARKDVEVNSNTSVNVENKTGTELPETGGMGTTLFYVVGGLMMAAAVVLLVSKKKVNA